MPSARPDRPSQQTGFRPPAPVSVSVSRNDSLRSEKSDKKVSFNKDVGIKHIPRGQQDQLLLNLQNDEWADCVPVQLEPPILSPKELEQQAKDLVRLLSQVDCVSGSKPVTNLTHSLDRTNNKKVNNIKAVNSEKKNNLVNGGGHFAELRAKNVIGNDRKDNLTKTTNLNNRTRPARRSSSLHFSTTDINDSDLAHPYKNLVNSYKSVPDLPATIYYDNKNRADKNFNFLIKPKIKDNNNFSSVDNLYKDNNRNRKISKWNSFKRSVPNECDSANHLTRIIIPGSQSNKSYENQRDNCYPIVGNMIKRLNSDSEERDVRHHKIYIEEDGSRGYTGPNILIAHNNNRPFSYTSTPLTSVDAVRRVSPSRDKSYPSANEALYSQVKRRDNRATRSSSREYDHAIKNSDSDYSAKIIITGNDSQSRFYDDDDAYETYQVGENSLSSHVKKYGLPSNNIMNHYRKQSSNFNMSSIGCQTDRLRNGPARSRRNVNSMSPVRQDIHNGHGEDLPSASLVRKINDGFGRFDRSPSPILHRPSYVKNGPFKNVVPLLSDTEDSEYDNHNKSLDPMVRIRNQAMIRERLQKNEERRESRFHERRHRSLQNFSSPELQPMTVDEMEAFTSEMERKKRFYQFAKAGDTRRSHSSPPLQRKVPDGKERSISPRLYSTLERLRKTANMDNSKRTIERTVEKNKPKEKKKKKIKIKFFYEPRPQDKQIEDPLKNFTMYEGRSSEYSPRIRRRSHEDPSNDVEYDSKYDFRSLPRDTYLNRDDRSYMVTRTMNGSRASPTRPPRSGFRGPTRDSQSAYKGEPISDYEGRNYSSDRNASESEEQPSNVNRIRNKFHTEQNDAKEIARSYRKRFSDDNDTDHPDSSDQGPSLSDKYRQLSRRDPSPKSCQRNQEVDAPKKEKIMRQRNKFWGGLVGEGKTKSPSLPKSACAPLSRDDPVKTNALSKTENAPMKKSFPKSPRPKRSRPWPWAFWGLRGGAPNHKLGKDINKVSRPTSRASSKSSSAPRPSVRSSKIRNDWVEHRPYSMASREADHREKQQWDHAALPKAEPLLQRPSSNHLPVRSSLERNASSNHRYLVDAERERNGQPMSAGDYRSLPNMKPILNGTNRRALGTRKVSPGARGSAGSSLQSSESEADSQGGSHASKASHVSTGSNRSVYLHATAVADIPVRRSSDESPSEKGASRQARRVGRSFSLISPWKPRYYRDRYEIEYDNREVKEAEKKNALPPRPPRKGFENRKVERSQTVYKDSKLAEWLRKKRSKEAKGI